MNLNLLLDYLKECTNEYILYHSSVVASFEINKISTPENSSDNSIVWLGNNYSIIEFLKNSSKNLIITSQSIDSSFEVPSDVIIIESKYDKWIFSRLAKKIMEKEQVASIHESSIIHKEAKIGKNVIIGPQCYIGKCVIGEGTIIEGHNFIYDDVLIGENCVIATNSVIGASGSGFVKNPDGNWESFPQIGKLVIGNNVEIGSNTYVNKGALADSNIGDHTKIGLSCCIGHNIQIGKNCMILANSVIAGGAILDDNAYVSIGVSVRNKVKVGKNAFIGMGAVVVRDIPQDAVVYGNPAKQRIN